MRTSARWTLGFALCLLPLLLAGCPGGNGNACKDVLCSGHGTCDPVDGEAVCTCEAGYAGAMCADCAAGFQDKDGDGTCLAECGEGGCSSHGVCDDSSGAPTCVCDAGYAGEACADCAEGYQDNDADGTCLAACSSLDWSCSGHGQCDDSSGQAACTCEAGYQDNDADGTCQADCATAGLDCGDHGACDDAGGEPACACDEGWGGADCTDCAEDWQDNDGDGVCEPGCGAGVIDCGDHGFCKDDSGQAACTCLTGHQGDDCSECMDGYQDNDGDGACMPGCDLFGGSCGAHGHCDDSTGEPGCVCDEGHEGDDCSVCAAGYQDNDGDGTCHPDCAAAALACGAHGACDDASGLSICVCDAGYAGDECEGCAVGFQDYDGDGECAADCAHAGLGCDFHAHCEDATGTAVCICDEGYTGADCSGCDAGYQDLDGDGTCLPTCDQLGWDCSGHGQCDDSDGTAGCACDAAYTGDQCQSCAQGYQDNDGDGLCGPDCAMANLNCSGYSHCEDSTGTAVCVCDQGYEGAACDTCAAGYQDDDGDGTCLPTCETLGWDCSGHGTCVYVGGAAECACEDGYVDDGLGHCLQVGAGESCLAPLLLDLAAGSVTGDTTGMGDNLTGGCGNNAAEEVVYVFSVVQPIHVTFDLSGSSYDTLMYLRSVCDDPGTELDCNDDGGDGTTSRIEIDLDVGTYYLIVDGYSSNHGQYLLSIDVACGAGYIYYPVTGECVPDPCLPNPCTDANKHVCEPVLPDAWTCLCDPGYIDDPNAPGTCIPDPDPHGEACADAMPLAIGEGTVSGTTTDAADDDSGSCAGNGPDRVYGFVLNEPMRAEFLMTGYDTVLHLRTTCDDPGSEVACNDDTEGQAAKITAILDPGTYFLWADSYSNPGDYDLIYSFRTDPCAPDPCPGTPECQAAPDWSDYECYCPAGTLPYGNDCVDDPCDPNECVEAHKNRCVPELPGNYSCECNIGYIPDPNDPATCIMDPDANEWAFIVFINADNNLEQDGYDDVGEMGQAGSTPYVHIAGLFDTASGPANVIYITQGGYDVVEGWGEQDMGDWQTLRDFGVWAVQNYPARHYAFIMWDHGDGWKGDQPQGFKGFSNDEHGNYDGISISNGDYAAALQGITDALGDKLDIVGFDACLMGMWEVAEASAPYAHYLVASEETEPLNGWAYHNFLPGLIANWQMDAEELGISIVDAYYNETSSDATQAISNLDTLDSLAVVLSDFADALVAHPELYSQIDGLRSDTQSFYTSTHRDILDFAERVSGMAGVPADLQAAADALIAQLQVTIVYSRAQSGYPGAKGLAIYFPSYNSSVDPAYQDSGAVWSQRTTWDEFLLDFAN